MGHVGAKHVFFITSYALKKPTKHLQKHATQIILCTSLQLLSKFNPQTFEYCIDSLTDSGIEWIRTDKQQLRDIET